jgi:hypothetical protein
MYHLCLVALVLVVSTLPACTRINVDVDSAAAWSHKGARTYKWRPEPEGSFGDPRIDEKQVTKLIRLNTDTILAEKGYVLTDTENTDLEVGYWIAIGTESAARSPGSTAVTGDARPNYWRGGRVSSSHVEKGSINIYVVDPTTKKKVWRASARAVINANRSREKRAERVTDAVQRMVSQFPRAEP